MGRLSSIVLPNGANARLMMTARINPFLPLTGGGGPAPIFSPEDLFASGEVGFTLDLSDTSKLFQDYLGETPVTSPGDPVGLVIDSRDLNGASVTVADGSDTTVAFIGFATLNENISGQVTPGKLHYFSIELMTDVDAKFFSVGFGNANTDPSNGIAFNLWGAVGAADGSSNSTAGVWYTTTGYAFVPEGSNCWLKARSRDFDDNELHTLSWRNFEMQAVAETPFLQETAARRPIYTRHPKSGVRQLLDSSEDFTSADWTKDRMFSVTGQTLVADTTAGLHNAYQLIDVAAGGVTCTTVKARAAGLKGLGVYMQRGGAYYAPTFNVEDGSQINNNFVSGGVLGAVFATCEVDGDVATIRVTAEWLSAGNAEIYLRLYDTVANNQFFSGNNVDGVEIVSIQTELGEYGPYQTRVSQYDVTETGVDDCYGLTFDGVDDFLQTPGASPMTGPDLTTALGLFVATDFSVAERILSYDDDVIGNFSMRVSSSGYLQTQTNRGVANSFAPGSTRSAPDYAVMTGTSDPSVPLHTIREDGVETGTSAIATGTTPWSGGVFTIGSIKAVSGAFFTGVIYDGATAIDRNLTLTEQADLETYIAARTPEVLLAGAITSPSDIFRPTDNGATFDLATTDYLFQDSQGITPVTSPGDPVGLMLDVKNGAELGIERCPDPTFDNPAVWTGNFGAVTIAGGTATFGAGFCRIRAGGVLFEIGKLYKLSVDITRVDAAGTLNFAAGGAQAEIPDTNTVGTKVAYIVSTSASANVEIYTTGSNTWEGEFDNYTIKDVSGTHFLQATAASRPIWTRHPKSGVRNLWDGGEDFSLWSAQSGAVYTADAVPGGHQLDLTNGANSALFEDTVSGAGTWTHSFEMWSAAGGEEVDLLCWNGTDGERRSATITLTTTPTRYSFTATSTVADRIYIISAGSTVTIYFNDYQLEEGATATTYQSRVSQYDVTEAGSDDCYGLTFDGVDDHLLSVEDVDFSGSSTATATLGFQVDDNTLAGGPFSVGDTANTAGAIQLRSPGAGSSLAFYPLLYTTTIVANPSADQFVLGVPLLATAGYNSTAASVTLRTNGVLENTITDAVNTTPNLASGQAVIGSFADNSGTYNTRLLTGVIYDGFTLIDRAVGPGERAGLEAYIAARTPTVTLPGTAFSDEFSPEFG